MKKSAKSFFKGGAYIEPQVPNYNLNQIKDMVPGVLERGKSQLKGAAYREPQVPNYNLNHIKDLVPGVLERGIRKKEVVSRERKRLCPTNSERMNRALKELQPSAFKIHTLLWKWRGAPARGKLPFFTVHSLSKFCNLSRPTIRAGLKELSELGWIECLGYNPHHKNQLYKLVPIRDVIPPATARPPRTPPQ